MTEAVNGRRKLFDKVVLSNRRMLWEQPKALVNRFDSDANVAEPPPLIIGTTKFFLLESP